MPSGEASAQLRITDVDGHEVTALRDQHRTGGPAIQCPTWNCGTAAGPGERTGTESLRKPGSRLVLLCESQIREKRFSPYGPITGC
jgi:hypothetical protein